MFFFLIMLRRSRKYFHQIKAFSSRHLNEMKENWENTAFPSWKMCAIRTGKRTFWEGMICDCVSGHLSNGIFPNREISHSFSMCNIRKMRKISSIFRVVEFFSCCLILHFMIKNFNFKGQDMQPELHKNASHVVC